MKKVLLINTNIERAPYPVPPLGLCLLAAALGDKYVVKIYDGVFDEGRGLVDLVKQFKPDFIGFSIRNIDDVVNDREIFYMDGILEKFIRPVKAATNVPVILGGSGFSIFPIELMELTGADYGIVGEGEDTLPILLDYIQNQEDVTCLPNLVTKGSKVIHLGDPYKFSKDISSQFSEIDHRIDFGPYRAKGAYSIQTKRGCAHRCLYCTYPVIEGRKFRTRKPSDVVDEIESAHDRLGDVTFEFVDSTFNDPKGHAEAICQEIINRKMKVRLRTMGINPRHSSEELFELMLRAGFVQIDATPDSASPRVLEKLDKGFKLSDVEKMALIIKKLDFPTMWFFLFGGPGENAETFRETLDFIDLYVNPADLVYMNAGLRVYPQTPLYNVALNEGRVLEGQSILQPPVYYHSNELTKKELDDLIWESTLKRHNCLHPLDTTPPAEMIAEAVATRAAQKLNEPMFRTLLRIRKNWRDSGRQ